MAGGAEEDEWVDGAVGVEWVGGVREGVVRVVKLGNISIEGQFNKFLKVVTAGNCTLSLPLAPQSYSWKFVVHHCTKG